MNLLEVIDLKINVNADKQTLYYVNGKKETKAKFDKEKLNAINYSYLVRPDSSAYSKVFIETKGD